MKQKNFYSSESAHGNSSSQAQITKSKRNNTMFHTTEQIGETWYCAYWRQSYIVLSVETNSFGFIAQTVRWADGSTTTHGTPIGKNDYRIK